MQPASKLTDSKRNARDRQTRAEILDDPNVILKDKYDENRQIPSKC